MLPSADFMVTPSTEKHVPTPNVISYPLGITVVFTWISNLRSSIYDYCYEIKSTSFVTLFSCKIVCLFYRLVESPEGETLSNGQVKSY